ncbi:hypothetical protein [Virgisporangium aurantiacum]|uniref:Uncharacterized protein n=1 Tax=Virgisporangium aurantiacum TaxID=175570 RepID=A0A8J3ZG40_9ACTN|nr:hypothetical protein [Virgisporangium aurantiacum]GIJ63497.1 hypothetical protein Vau01_110130 [Virgisporangium aurantiacum]
MHGWLGGIGALIVFALLVWGLFLMAGVLTVKAHVDLNSQVTAWTNYRDWAPVTEPSPLLLKAADADKAVLAVRGDVGGYTCTIMYVTGFESFFLACALRLPGITGRVALRRRGRLSYAVLRGRALFQRRPRTHTGLPEPDVLDLGFERAYRVTLATGPAATLMTPPVRRRLARAAATIPVQKVRITDDLVMITADTWTVHGHLDPLVEALTAIAEAARAEVPLTPWPRRRFPMPGRDAGAVTRLRAGSRQLAGDVDA